jgi:hypothetical protein
MNESLATNPAIQELKNLSSLTEEQREELRMYYVLKTGIPQKKTCGDCLLVWARVYRNDFNSLPKKEVKEVKKEVEPKKEVKDGKDGKIKAK